MKKKPNPRLKKTTLNRNEWFFPDVPKGERESCFRFEYTRELARESLTIRELLNTWRAGLKQPIGTAERRASFKAKIEIVRRIGACFPDQITLIDESFPDEPWQELDEELRKQIVQDHIERLENLRQQRWSSALSIRMQSELESDEGNIRMFQFLHEFLSTDDFSQTEYGLFAIDWNYSVSEIQDSFRHWLKEQMARHRPGMAVRRSKAKTGRGAGWDRLNALGAFRVVKHCVSDEEVWAYTKEKLGYQAYYGTVRALHEAAERAHELLEMLLARVGN